MTTDENTNNLINAENIDERLEALLKDVEFFNTELDQNKIELEKSLAGIESNVDNSVKNLDQIFSDLEKIEEEAVTEFEALEKEQG